MYVIERDSQQGSKRPVGGEGIKIFGVTWDKDLGIVSGGEDKMVQINRGTGVTNQ
jgi:ribosome biogenesis protein YTM1